MITTEQKLLYIQSYMQINKVVIAFSGHSGIGKTTISEWLSKTLQVNYMPEVARMLLPLLNNSNIRVRDFQDLVITAYESMLYNMIICPNFSLVCDRIINDVYSYSALDNNRSIKKVSEVMSKEKNYNILITLSDLPIDNTKDHRELTDTELNNLDKYLKIGQQAVISGGAHHIHLESTVLKEREDQVIHEIYKYIESKVK